jgi:hypothetical protein
MLLNIREEYIYSEKYKANNFHVKFHSHILKKPQDPQMPYLPMFDLNFKLIKNKINK